MSSLASVSRIMVCLSSHVIPTGRPADLGTGILPMRLEIGFNLASGTVRSKRKMVSLVRRAKRVPSVLTSAPQAGAPEPNSCTNSKVCVVLSSFSLT